MSTIISKWYKMFKEDKERIKDEPSSGKSFTSTSEL